MHGTARLTLPAVIAHPEVAKLRQALEVLGVGPLEVLLDGSQVRAVSADGASLLRDAVDLLRHPTAQLRIVSPSRALTAALRAAGGRDDALGLATS